MKWLSEILMPLSKSRPSKIKDVGLAKLVQCGAGIWNPNESKLILLPTGKKLFTRVEKLLVRSLKDFRPQRTDTCGSARGALDVAVRIIKRAEDLPLLLAERRGHTLCLLGFCPDTETAVEMANDAVRVIGSAAASLGVSARRVDRTTSEGRCIDLLCAAPAPLHGEEGLSCPDCGWTIAYDSPFNSGTESADAELQEMKEVLTPDCSTIEKLCSFLGVAPEQTIKIMFYSVNGALTAVVVRGDRQVSMEKLRAHLGGAEAVHAERDELDAVMGGTAGFMGPVGLPDAVTLIADTSVVGMKNAVAGANKVMYHLTGVCWGRDFSTENIADVTVVQESDACPHCHGHLRKSELRRIARFFPADPACASESSLTFFNGKKKVHVPAWSAEIDLTSLLSAVIEDADRWPESLSPFDEYIYWDGDAPKGLSALANILEQNGRRAIADDRPGKKLKDRADEAASSFVPETLFIREQGAQLIIEASRGGTKETLTPEQFAERLAADAPVAD